LCNVQNRLKSVFPKIQGAGQVFLQAQHGTAAAAAGAEEIHLLSVGGLEHQSVFLVFLDNCHGLCLGDFSSHFHFNEGLGNGAYGHACFCPIGLFAGFTLDGFFPAADTGEDHKGGLCSFKQLGALVIVWASQVWGNAFMDGNGPHLGAFCRQEGYPETLFRGVGLEIPDEFRGEPIDLEFVYAHHQGDIGIKIFPVFMTEFQPAFFDHGSQLFFQFLGG